MRSACAAAVVSLLLLSGCGKPPEAPTAQVPPPAPKMAEAKPAGKGGVIGLSVLTSDNPFFKQIGASMDAEAKKSGYTVETVSADFDAAKQLQQVKDFIAKKVVAIVLTPADSRAVGTAIKEANTAGIPVFTADIASMAADAKVVSHIATDNYAGGREAAKAMIKALGSKGKVAVIDHPVVESVLQRTKGFEDELKEQKSAIEVVGKWPGKGSKDESFKTAQDILTKFGDLAGIFAINDPSALGAVAAIEKANKQGKIVVVGFDGQLEGKQAILEGKIYADPIQFPEQIGTLAAQTIAKHLEGETVKAEQLIPTKLYYKEDAQKDPELKVPAK